MQTKQVIVLRKDLNMRKGKMVAQGAHASMAAILDLGGFENDGEVDYFSLQLTSPLKEWLEGRFTKVCVSVNSEEELLNVYNLAKHAGLICSLIKDAGLTEFDGVPTYTAVAVGPAEVEEVDKRIV